MMTSEILKFTTKKQIKFFGNILFYTIHCKLYIFVNPNSSQIGKFEIEE